MATGTSHTATVEGRFGPLAQLVALPFALAVTTATVITVRPSLLPRLLMLDISVLAYGHMVASYCRVLTMHLTARQRRILLLDAPLAFVCATVFIFYIVPSSVVAAVYMIWQMVHYQRQAYGIERLISRRDGQTPTRSTTLFLYGAGAAPFLWALSGTPGGLLGSSVPRSLGLVKLLIVIVAGCSLVVALATFRAVLSRPRLPRLFSLSHACLFALAYGVLPSLDQAWITANVWHNTQYVLIVRTSIGAGSSSALGRRIRSAVAWRGGVMFAVACAAAGIGMYTLLSTFVRAPSIAFGPAAMACYTGLNLHHYAMDALIWKRRSPLLDFMA